jgi:lycopene cyclase domain-containing protein
MTYFGFLAVFLGIPLIGVGAALWVSHRLGRGRLPDSLSGAPAWIVILAHSFVAVAYTTPWDNYLVAASVWWYDPARVIGLTLGWVPIEEYTFFVLQSLLAGMWIILLAGWGLAADTPEVIQREKGIFRWLAALILAVFWLAAAWILAFGWRPGTYLALILIWAIPPIAVQVIFGGAILWRHRRLVAVALASSTLYLSVADALAIRLGVWTIDPQQSVGMYLFGALPVEEFVFFLATNTLLVFGVTLVLSRDSQAQARNRLQKLRAWLGLAGPLPQADCQ